MPLKKHSGRYSSKNHRMNTKPIKTEADHHAVLEEIETLMSAHAGTPEGDRLDVRVTQVEDYEKTLSDGIA